MNRYSASGLQRHVPAEWTPPDRRPRGRWGRSEMRRRFTSVRLGVGALAGIRERNVRKLDRNDREPGGKLARPAKKHSVEAIFGVENPREAAHSSSLIVISRIRTGGDGHVDP
jgi:hypothetical protein